MKLTTASLKKLIREELNEMSRASGSIALTEEYGYQSYEMKDGTEFHVGVYKSNSGEKRLKVKVNGKDHMVGDVSKEKEIIRKLQGMDLKTAKSFGGPLFEEKGKY